MLGAGDIEIIKYFHCEDKTHPLTQTPLSFLIENQGLWFLNEFSNLVVSKIPMRQQHSMHVHNHIERDISVFGNVVLAIF